MNINFGEFSLTSSNLSNNNATFVDLNNDFKINEIEKHGTDISVLDNYKAIRQALYNIVFTPKGSMNVLMEFGSRYHSFLGQPLNESTAYALGEEIARDIRLLERRVTNVSVNILLNPQCRGFEIVIVYDIPSLEFRFETLSLFLNEEHRSLVTV